MSENETDPIDALVRDLDAAAVPAGFADRVVATHMARRRRGSRAITGALAGIGGLAVAGLVAGVVALFVSGGDVGSNGDVAAGGERKTVHMGDRVIAVVEPQGEVVYEAGAGGVEVAQPSGSAFYRVEKGTPTTIHTGGGDVVVHGTCFTVDVKPLARPPSSTGVSNMSKQSIVTAAAGALVGAIVTVAVFEGEVAFANEKGEVVLQAGDRAVASADHAPVMKAAPSPVDVARLRAENDRLASALDAAQAASGGDVGKLIDENRALRAKLKSADDELALADADRKDKEGTELPFPKDLPARFSEKELLASFTAAIKQAGIAGDVTHIDCAEYPCIVYGDVKVSSDMDATKISEKMKNAAAFAPYKDDEDNSSWWRALKKNPETGETEDETHFGIALWPKAEGQDSSDDASSDPVSKRIGFRNQQMWDAMKPAKH